jgi:hypothetical protein
MSSNLAYSAPMRRPVRHIEPEPELPRRVQIVTTRTQRRARPKLVYAAVATGAIFAIFLAQLLLTIALSGGAYKITDLQSEQRSLGRVASSLHEEVNNASSTQNLAANAQVLGMVLSPQQAFIRLSTGAVVGKSTAAPRWGKFTATNGSTDSVPNALLADIPLVSLPTAGHGTSNAADSNTGSTDSKAGSVATTAEGPQTKATAPDNGDLPSPVTH